MRQLQRAALAECISADAAHGHSNYTPCCGGFLVPVSPAQCDEARRVEVQ